MRKKILIAVIITAVVAISVVGLAACDPYADYDYAIAVIQPVSHDALAKTYDGLRDSLTEKMQAAGKTIYFDFQNANGSETEQVSIIESFVNKKPDIIYAIATAAANTAAQKTYGTDVKVIFNAVTDPTLESAKIVADWNNPGANVTGVSDMNPVALQLQVMKYLMGNTNDFKIGVLYTSSEPNSITQSDMLIAECLEKGIISSKEQVVVKTISLASDITSALFTSFKNEGVDILYLPTDNLIANSAGVVHEENRRDAKLPIVCGESSMNSLCGIATVSVDYYQLGVIAADMAYDILINGKDTATMPVRMQNSGFEYTISNNIAEQIGFTIPDGLEDYLEELVA